MICSSRIFAQGIFHTSMCYDLLCTIDKFGEDDKLNEFCKEKGLSNDSMFIACAAKVYKSVRASNLCNIYSTAHLDKDNIPRCIDFFSRLDTASVPLEYKGAWLRRIVNVKSELNTYLTALHEAGYSKYWKENIEPVLLKSIESYVIRNTLIDSIHCEINSLAGPEVLGNTYPKTYVLDIGNAFNLLDETFCTTYLLLDKEIAKKYRINFIQVYIHENLHRLRISPQTVHRLEALKQSDDFYRINEEKARDFNEGLNEAFVVAAESFISKRLGLKTQHDVYTEFSTYCDGTIVLAPIIYTHLKEKRFDETFDGFINRLFREKKIDSGKIMVQYELAMKSIKLNFVD